jgi:hypothetical protein
MGPKTKKTASSEELSKLYDPNYFYEHGDNPAMRHFVNIMQENVKGGK